jgi:hypothetical protein
MAETTTNQWPTGVGSAVSADGTVVNGKGVEGMRESARKTA